MYAKPRQETVARTNLVRQGYEIYLPLVRQPRKRKGRRVTVIAPRCRKQATRSMSP